MSRFDVNFPSNNFHKINKALYYDYIPNGENTKESSYGIEHSRNINFGDNKMFKFVWYSQKIQITNEFHLRSGFYSIFNV